MSAAPVVIVGGETVPPAGAVVAPPQQQMQQRTWSDGSIMQENLPTVFFNIKLSPGEKVFSCCMGTAYCVSKSILETVPGFSALECLMPCNPYFEYWKLQKIVDHGRFYGREISIEASFNEFYKTTMILDLKNFVTFGFYDCLCGGKKELPRWKDSKLTWKGTPLAARHAEDDLDQQDFVYFRAKPAFADKIKACLMTSCSFGLLAHKADLIIRRSLLSKYRLGGRELMLVKDPENYCSSFHINSCLCGLYPNVNAKIDLNLKWTDTYKPPAAPLVPMATVQE